MASVLHLIILLITASTKSEAYKHFLGGNAKKYKLKQQSILP